MLTRQEAISACMALPFAVEDYPFHDDNWTVMRHLGNGKIFAMIFSREDRIWINVKVDPAKGDLWRSAFSAVVPAYHMNKQHWVSIILDGTMEEADILMLLSDSHALTAPKRKHG